MNDQDLQTYYENNPSARWFALASICLTNFLNSTSHSAVNIAIPDITLDLHASAILVSWIPTSYLFTSVIALLPAGRLADIYGRKIIYLTGIFIFTIASILSYFATNIEWLLLTRLLQGLGSALVFATGLAIVMSIFSTSNRGTALGLASASVYIGLSCGPLLGGWFTEAYGWRSVFLFSVPVALLATALVLTKLKGTWKSEEPMRVDWLGSLIFAFWSGALFVGVSLLPAPMSFVLLLLSVFGLILFVYQQLRSPYPLVRFKAIMENRVFSRSLIANVCTYSSNYPLVFLFSLYLQFIQGLSPSEAGQIMLLQAVMMSILAPIAGRLSDHYEPRIIATAGCLIMAVAFAALLIIDTGTSLYFIAACLMVLGTGFGIFTTPNNNAALGAVNKSRLSIASALLNLARVMGNMLGSAVVLVLVSIIFGEAKIEPIQYQALLKVIHWALGLACLYTLLGAYFSYSRGNIH